MTTIVRYFVPEDKDIEDKPNAFIIYKSTNQIRFRDIVDNFPLPGEYHFRFKFEFKPEKSVWLDFKKEDTSVPLFKNKIIMKVSRISWNKNDLEDSNTNLGSNSNEYPDFLS